MTFAILVIFDWLDFFKNTNQSMTDTFENSLIQAIQSKNWPNVLNWCEQVELEYTIQDVKVPFNFYATQLFCYYITDDMENAKCFWKRISNSTKKTFSTELGQVWEIGKNIWQNDHVQVYLLLESQWPVELLPLIQGLQEAYRARMCNLVSNAYDNIFLKDLAEFVGTSDEQAKKFAESRNWKFDTTSQSFAPIPNVTKKKDKGKNNSEVLASLTDRALFLELN
jgi:hypothetical protein